MVCRDSLVISSKCQVSSEVGEDVVILNLKSGEYFGLDEVGRRVWELIQEPQVVTDIIESLLGEYDVEPSRCEDDVIRLLHELIAVGIVETRDGTTA